MIYTASPTGEGEVGSAVENRVENPKKRERSDRDGGGDEERDGREGADEGVEGSAEDEAAQRGDPRRVHRQPDEPDHDCERRELPR